jgi:hypothetical protein
MSAARKDVFDMAVFRVERTRDYTVMSNHHLKDKALTLKAKGLLSMMLSLPDDWDYTTRGLASICREGVDAIGKALKELENAGYMERRQLRGKDGRITDTEYTIYEQPRKAPGMPFPDMDLPDTEKPDLVHPDTEKPAQLNTKETNIPKKSSTYEANPYQSYPENRKPEAGAPADPMDAIDAYREIIKGNISYDVLQQKCDLERLDEIVGIMLDTVCSRKKKIRISSEDMPAEAVKSRLLALDDSHIEYVLECLDKSTTDIRNIRSYILTALYQAPTTISSYYSALVNHDMYGSGPPGR